VRIRLKPPLARVYLMLHGAACHQRVSVVGADGQGGWLWPTSQHAAPAATGRAGAVYVVEGLEAAACLLSPLMLQSCTKRIVIDPVSDGSDES
jgi:hypothetical protein